MKTKLSYLNSMLGVAVLLLVASAGALAQEGYFGATDTMAFSAEPSLPVWVARSEFFSGGGDGYYGAQQPLDTCAQSREVTVSKAGHLVLVRGTKIGSAILASADLDEQNSNCADRRSKSLRGIPSASQNQVEYGGGGM